jgi:hypothetical protein
VEGFSLVSVYAFDPVRREVVVVWPATAGSLSQAVAPVATTVSEGHAGSLCAALTRLSDALWDVYVRPASAAADGQERERREHERQQFDGVVAAVREPNLPDQSGSLVVSYSPVEKSAHRLGRVLHKLSDAAVADAVIPWSPGTPGPTPPSVRGTTRIRRPTRPCTSGSFCTCASEAGCRRCRNRCSGLV